MNNRKEALIQLWDKVALNYSKLGPDYWDRFGKRLVDLSNISEGDYILDMGSGRGSTLFPAAILAGENGKVIGTDLSENMVSLTNDEIISKGIKNANVIEADMENLNFDDESFDKIIAGFSLGNILINERLLQKTIRLLKKQGVLSFSMWGEQDDQQWLTDIVTEFLKPSSDTNSNNKPSINLNSADGIRTVLTNAGLNNIEVYYESNEVIYKDEAQWWDEMWNNALRGIFEIIEKMGTDTYNEFKHKVNQSLKQFKNEKGIVFNMNVIYAVSTI